MHSVNIFGIYYLAFWIENTRMRVAGGTAWRIHWSEDCKRENAKFYSVHLKRYMNTYMYLSIFMWTHKKYCMTYVLCICWKTDHLTAFSLLSNPSGLRDPAWCSCVNILSQSISGSFSFLSWWEIFLCNLTCLKNIVLVMITNYFFSATLYFQYC